MADWQTLKDKLNSYPAGTTPDAMLADINANSIVFPVDVASRSVRGTLFATGVWGAIVKKANAAASGTDQSDVAISCQMLVDMAHTGDILPMTNSAVAAALQAQFTALVTAGVIQQSDHDAVMALASRAQSWAEQNDWVGVTVDQLNYALTTTFPTTS